MFGKDRMFSTSKARFDSRVSPPIYNNWFKLVQIKDLNDIYVYALFDIQGHQQSKQ